ncbi:unnamed protein product, partial [Staurois parvus]
MTKRLRTFGEEGGEVWAPGCAVPGCAGCPLCMREKG